MSSNQDPSLNDRQFSFPSGIVADRSDNVFVVDLQIIEHKSSHNTNNGSFITKWLFLQLILFDTLIYMDLAPYGQRNISISERTLFSV